MVFFILDSMNQKSQSPQSADPPSTVVPNTQSASQASKMTIIVRSRIKRYIIPIVGVFILMVGLTASMFLSQQSQDTRNYAKGNQASPKSPTDTIDILSYMTGATNAHHLDGTTGGMNIAKDTTQRIFYYGKWNSTSYEYYSWDTDYIYLKRDTSWGNGAPVAGGDNYTFDNGKWLKRTMSVGESVSADPNNLAWYKSDCSYGGGWQHPYTNTLLEHNTSFDTAADPDAATIGGSNIGIQDVIVMKYGNETNYEKNYYSKQWGWIKWEGWQGTTRSDFAVWYKNSGGFKKPTGKCGDPSPNSPNPTSPAGGAGRPITVKVVQKGSGQKYPNTLSIINYWNNTCKSGCASNCSDAACTSGGTIQTYDPNSCGGTGCAKWTDYTPNSGYWITACPNDDSPIGLKCRGKIVLPSSWKMTNSTCGNGQNLWIPPSEGETCTIEVSTKATPTPSPTGGEVKGFIFTDTNANGRKNNELTLGGIALTLTKKGGAATYTTSSTPDTSNYNYTFGSILNEQYTLVLSSTVPGYKLRRCSSIAPGNPPKDTHYLYCQTNSGPTLKKWRGNGLEDALFIKVSGEPVSIDFPMIVDSSLSPTPTPVGM